MKRIIEHTADGSLTLYVPEMDEHYHSTKGALTESRHIFIEMGMKHARRKELRILEIGFGTGLNAFLTLTEAEKNGQKTHYTGMELYPLHRETTGALHYTDSPLFRQMHELSWGGEHEMTPHFTLIKLNADFTNHVFSKEDSFDVIYFDAFAPEKQPDMWTQDLFDKLWSVTNTGGILTTYCAKGVIRRMLVGSGFTVERLPGPPGGKREILRATKP